MEGHASASRQHELRASLEDPHGIHALAGELRAKRESWLQVQAHGNATLLHPLTVPGAMMENRRSGRDCREYWKASKKPRGATNAPLLQIMKNLAWVRTGVL